MGAFVPEPFATPVVSSTTTTLFRRTPYISPSEFKSAPTAVATTNLVPNGSEAEQLAALAAVISRASDDLDTVCFHRADGTLAASPSTENGWVTSKAGGELELICNYKPILEVDGIAVGSGPQNMSSLTSEAAQNITIDGRIITVFAGARTLGRGSWWPAFPTRRGKVWVVWTYVNGYPHTALAKEAKAEDEAIEVEPSTPGGSAVYGVYPGTQLTIHDGADTEVVVVSSVERLKLNLAGELAYDHALPTAPDTTRVSAVPWGVEQACISLTSHLIKARGSRALTLPQTPGGKGSPPKQAEGQAGAAKDLETALRLLKPYIVPNRRST